MRSFLRKPIGKLIVAVSAAAMIAIVGIAIYLASLTGSLPWQTDPTRIAITPFADIPGFNLPVVTATPVTQAGTPAA
jgi:hypothetical protein